MIKLMFVLRSLKKRCYGNQLILGAFLNNEIDRLQAFLWRSEMEYRNLH